jgi:hypothetical protein
MKPVIYILELCDTKGEHRPEAVMQASMPFAQVSVGDRLDDEGWNRLASGDAAGTRGHPRRYIVHSIKHIVTEENEHIVARYCLNLTPYDGPRSPVWGDNDPLVDHNTQENQG